ncbi:uncharacterized protein LOC135619894 [Musa acuminata AAA Group]|uniref:uncharacterized protein LOC135619894 n=1 Tax=Musa acuminata AAA Group TaxID=214697 RepID=UPI0031E472E7
MGCVSSKVLTRSGSFHEELKRSLKGRSNGSEELFGSKNGGDRVLALPCTANSVAEPEKNSSVSSTEHTGTKQIDKEKHTVDPETEVSDVEIINTWELLAGLEEEEEEEEEHQEQSESDEHKTEEYKFVVGDELKAPANFNSASDHKDEDLVEAAQRHPSKEKPHVSLELPQERSSTGSKREAMARELAPLKLPSIEFSKTGSLKDWLRRGGQLISPGSYVTPKFGDFVFPEPRHGDNRDDDSSVFDPDLVAQFEQAMNQLSMDEEFALQQIIESLQQGDEEGIPRVELSC